MELARSIEKRKLEEKQDKLDDRMLADAVEEFDNEEKQIVGETSPGMDVTQGMKEKKLV